MCVVHNDSDVKNLLFIVELCREKSCENYIFRMEARCRNIRFKFINIEKVESLFEDLQKINRELVVCRPKRQLFS